MLMDMTVKEFIEELASNSPASGQADKERIMGAADGLRREIVEAIGVRLSLELKE